MSGNDTFSKGSEWRKWDLHIHTPSSIIQQYGGEAKWEEFISALEHLPSDVKVIGINDYYFIDGYEKVMQYRKQGRLANIEKIFPILEFRIDTFGSGSENTLQKINLHIVFNINEADLDNEIKKIRNEFIEQIAITKLEKHETKRLSIENLIKEGNNNLQDGFSNFIPSTDKVFELIHSTTWNKKTFLLLGYKEWSNLEKNNQLKPLKEDLYNKVNAFFTSNYETYQKSMSWLSEFGDKPLLHSCDIHGFDILDTYQQDENGNVIEPKNYNCNTWIKADPTFEGLKQIIYEPNNRVHIRDENPDKYRDNCINSISVDKEWFPQKELPLNKGLITIIGARGSGKTALLDFIALSAKVYCKNKANFLFKAKDKVKPLITAINFNGKDITQNFNPDEEFSEPLVQYLSQQFVENLCSEDGSTKLLQAEIERFIFENVDDIERMGTHNFTELKDYLCKPMEDTIKDCKNKIYNLNIKISQIHRMQTIDLPAKEKEKNNLKNDLNNLQAKLPKLDKVIQSGSLQDYEAKNIERIKLENELKIEYAQIKRIEQILSEIDVANKTLFQNNQIFRNELLNLGFEENLLLGLNINYNSVMTNISTLLNSKRSVYNVKVGSEISPGEGSYKFLLQKISEIQKKVNEYTENEKCYLSISNKIEQTKTMLIDIENQIINIKNLNIADLQKERLSLYKQIFIEIKKKKELLESLYLPLMKQLEKNNQEKQLGFFVKVNVDIQSWVLKGEGLIDLRRAKDFRDNESIFNRAKEKLYDAWINCDSDCIEDIIESFVNKEGKLLRNYLLKPELIVSLADWLFSTDHISISYEMTFNEVPLKLLSPGTKGILLMLLYLGVDKKDTRPLLIDQPEDNLDPESVCSVLVPYFIEAKKRRQIIMVTHNPNLVVATDSDQVIVATCHPKGVNELPVFNYLGGGLENPEIVNRICSVLEGGETAFRKREERYASIFKENNL